MVCSAILRAAYNLALKTSSEISSVFPTKICSIFGSEAFAISPN